MANDMLQLLEDAVAAGDAPYLIAMYGNGAGATWSGVAGDRAPGKPARIDTIFHLFSMTKAVTTSAAAILIDRGTLDLDTPADDFLPEIGKLQVLEGFDGAVPLLRPPRRRITVRHLATHTSGLAYPMGQAGLEAWLEATGRPSYFSRKREGLNHPLIFDPGEGWAYGTGVDWLGLLIERASGQSVDRFCQEALFEPLGMRDTCFELGDGREPRLSRFFLRGQDGAFIDKDGHIPYSGHADDEECHRQADYHSMGGCLFGTVPDYFRLLRMHMNGGELDGVRVIGEETARRLQGNLVGEIPAGSGWFPGPRKSHAFCFMRIEEDTPGMRGAGSCYWAGGANSHYWIDFANDVIGVFATCSQPFIEPRFMARFADFERRVYARAR